MRRSLVRLLAGRGARRARRPLARDFASLEEERRRHDSAQLALAAPVEAEPELTRLYRRSLLTLELLTDRETGATIAAPELDPDFVHCGGYGFVWPRDLAFVVLSFLAAGRGDLAAPALRWLARTQAPEGLWLHRHWTDGALAPSWGLHQLDETGSVLFAYESAWRALRDEELDRSLWPSARRAGSFLVAFLEPDTGLPRASVDLWEQHEGQHAYTAAATAAGLDSASAMAARHEPALEAGFREAAERVRAGIEAELWSEEHGRYLRTRRLGRRDREGEPVPPAFTTGLPYPNRAVLSVDPFDARVDSSLLGLAWPFRAVDPAGTRMRATAAAIERELLLPCGGVLRHEGDDYAGGNPWLLTTLWLGLYYRQVGDEAGLRRCVDYALSRRTELDLLPEQADRDGKPAWVLPLAWSHAMLVLAARPELELAATRVAGPRANSRRRALLRAAAVEPRRTARGTTLRTDGGWCRFRTSGRTSRRRDRSPRDRPGQASTSRRCRPGRSGRRAGDSRPSGSAGPAAPRPTSRRSSGRAARRRARTRPGTARA